ncbi:hypothetical protein TcWFU_004803 [Taenia crassiceps]|uniref:Uncharacterized protein n=1 Tax=Taenia crassiceps TaxID=6207 RepID=A0ABR4Q229_9CEST
MELDAPTESLGEEVEEERRILEAFTMNPKDGIGSLAEIEEMLKNNDTRLNYVLNGRPSRILLSSDIPQPPQSRVPKEPQEPPTQEEHEEDHRCVFCGFASDRLDAVLFHTEQEHPTKRNVIGLLRLRLLRAAFDPKGYRLNNAELTRVNAISVSRFSG